MANDTSPSNRIRELREAIGMSQAELARLANVTPPALQKVEVGSRKLDQQWMRRLAVHLGVTPADLLPAEDHPLQLSDQEREIIERFRSAARNEQETFERVADAILPYRGPERERAA